MYPHEQAKAKPTGDASPIDPRTFGLTKAAYSVNETLDVLSDRQNEPLQACEQRRFETG
jgi:hypothetical protein